ncbi:methyltransferase [Conexibacter stalactiti]|uniref:SAM-dependent methyltransferase n=1 Tax=Conexibacter stalactiti TaxID=1940611 RepID=A0ABU4HV44_9ACTN|nr:methyltransferase [Conexibacter stalactiti]MDW5597192.1 SAM-dependent methyltransferase [Conexibacter stalactiti]MEC5037834.1 methyltransferase [Conexibacter stalactiti]
MSGQPMTPAAFDALYRRDPDPWGYRERPYERAKYADTLRACGPGPFDAALELGGSIGEFTALLTPRCRRLRSLDASPAAVELARERLAALPAGSPRDRVPQRDPNPHSSDAVGGDVHALLGTIPADLPHDRFDLVVASEVLYYLPQAEFDATLVALRERLAPGGRLVAVHYVPPGPERPLTAAAVHAALRAQPWLASVERSDRGDYLLDVLESLPRPPRPAVPDPREADR